MTVRQKVVRIFVSCKDILTPSAHPSGGQVFLRLTLSRRVQEQISLKEEKDLFLAFVRF